MNNSESYLIVHMFYSIFLTFVIKWRKQLPTKNNLFLQSYLQQLICAFYNYNISKLIKIN